MRALIVNDSSTYHSGCAAVMEYLISDLLINGYSITDCIPHSVNPTSKVHKPAFYDVLIVNGEGSIHHCNRVSSRLMSMLEYGLTENKKCYLVNSVWDSMGDRWKDVLSSLDRVCVREILSKREMEDKCGVSPEIFLDLSYWCPVAKVGPKIDYSKQKVIGDFFYENPKYANPQFFLPLRHGPWGLVIRSLRTASAYITGRHHGVYAACKAEVPFEFDRSNTHKVLGFLKWYNEETGEAGWQDQKGLWEWMKQKPKWTIADSSQICCS